MCEFWRSKFIKMTEGKENKREMCGEDLFDGKLSKKRWNWLKFYSFSPNEGNTRQNAEWKCFSINAMTNWKWTLFKTTNMRVNKSKIYIFHVENSLDDIKFIVEIQQSKQWKK